MQRRKKMRERHELNSLLSFALITFWYEFVIKILCFGPLSIRWNQWLMTLGFSLFYGLLLYYIYAWIVKKKWKRIFVYTVISLYSVLFISQYIYYRAFDTFMSLSSMVQGGGDAADHFLGQALVVTVRGIPGLILFLLPVFYWWRNRCEPTIVHHHPDTRSRKLALAGSVLFYFLTIFFIQIQDAGSLPSSLLYYHRFVPKLQIQEFGLLTTERLDLKHNFILSKPDETLEARPVQDVNGLLEKELNYETPLRKDQLGFSFPRLATEPFNEESDSGDPAHKELIQEVKTFREQLRHSSKEERAKLRGAKAPRRLTTTEKMDFRALRGMTTNKELASMHFYFGAQPSRENNRYTGLFKEKNLIWIMAESHSPLAMDPELTPTLCRLKDEGLQVPNYYNPLWGVSTTDGEYSQLLSQYPVPGLWSMYETRHDRLDDVPSQVFKNAGYATYARHNFDWTYYQRNITHANLGFDYKGLGGGVDIPYYFPPSDVDLFNATLDECTAVEPFFLYYLTMSGHMMYEPKFNDMANRHFAEVRDLDREWTNQARGYVAANLEIEDGVTAILETLDEKGLLDDTVLLVTNDHYPYGLSESSLKSLIGETDDPFARYRGTFILWTPDMARYELPEIEDYAAAVDVAPTIMNLFGLPFDARLLVGHDLLGTLPGEVLYQDYSWQSLFGCYDAFHDIYEPSPVVQQTALDWAMNQVKLYAPEDEEGEAASRPTLFSKEAYDIETLMNLYYQQLIRQENARVDLRFVMSHAFLSTDYERVLHEGERATNAYHKRAFLEEMEAANQAAAP